MNDIFFLGNFLLVRDLERTASVRGEHLNRADRIISKNTLKICYLIFIP